MLPEEEVLAEKILDDIFYPSFDALEGVKEEENQIKSLNFS